MEGEIESGKKENDAKEASFEEEGDGLVLDNFFGAGVSDGIKMVHGDASATEPDSEDDSRGRLCPGGKGGRTKAEADISGIGDIAIEGGLWHGFRGCGEPL